MFIKRNKKILVLSEKNVLWIPCKDKTLNQNDGKYKLKP